MINQDRLLGGATVAVIVAVALISGPLVGSIDLTQARDGDAGAELGSGSLEASVVSLPDDPRLVRGEYGSGAYYLRVPPAIVEVSNVEGRPALVYKIRIFKLNYVRQVTSFLKDGSTGQRRLSVGEDALRPEMVTRDRYEGELVLIARSDGNDRMIAQKNVTVTVEE